MFAGFSTRGSTPISRLHPFSKMGVGAGFTAYSLFLMHPISLGILLGFLLIAALIARINFSFRKGIGLLCLLAFFGALNFFASENPQRALGYCLRLCVFMAAVPVMAATTAPQDMVRALSRLRLPPGIVVSLLLVWRFFPIMAAEAKEMQQAAALRGKNGGGPFHRIYRGFLVPLAFAVVEYADRISLSLEIRGFSPGTPRTYYSMPHFGKADAVYICLGLMACILAGFFQWGGYI